VSLRRRRPPIAVAAGERVLADAVAEGAHLAGTRDAFYALAAGDAAPLRVAWEAVQAADWDADATTLTVTEVGTWGEPRPRHVYVVREPGRLLELVRERVTASVVLQRHVPIAGRRGVRVVGRRAPGGAGPVEWLYEFDQGIDPADPTVLAAAREALAAAQAEVGPV
jgi:hypothetical protein